MIISASRRTDIPACYSEWFYNRLREGCVLVRNPVVPHRIGRIDLSPELVDGIVFWTKNPAPMLQRLPELDGYMYVFQCTITPYGRDIEPQVPDKNEVVLPAFRELSRRLGPKRMIWRYDPILINGRYTAAYHLRAFERLASALQGFTEKVTISFIDVDYKGVKRNAAELGLAKCGEAQQRELAARLAEIAHRHGLRIDACAEALDLSEYGIGRARCIDGGLFAELLGSPLRLGKDRSQRPECGCAAGIDIGLYNSCTNGCRYCYANYDHKAVALNREKHDPLSPLLSGHVTEADTVTERKVRSNREDQMRIF